MNEQQPQGAYSGDPTESLPPPPSEGCQLRTGDKLGNRFVIVRFLGRGGMGEVYEAIDEHLQGKHIAIKTLRPEIATDADMRARFEREVLLAREVNHRNVCPTFDLLRLEGPSGSVLCLSMRLLRGESLSARLRRAGPLTPEDALAIARQLAAGLDAAHAAGVIHRDFKPGNVILEFSTQEPHVLITDFGLARLYDSDHTIGSPGQVAGTRGYIAPELFEGRTASPASDLYAFGVVLHEMLMGRQPVLKPGSVDFARPSSLRPELPGVWDRVILGCLASDPAQRFRSATEAIAALDTPSGRRSVLTHSVSRRRWLWIVGSVAASGALLYAVTGLDDLLHPLPQRRYVALMAWPRGGKTADNAVLNNLLDGINDRLVRAESYEKDLLVIGPRDVGAQQKPNTPEDAMTTSGANLVLAVSIRGPSDVLRLQLLDPASRKLLRHRSLRLNRAELARMPEEAAVAAARLLSLPSRPRHWKDQDELATLSAPAYELFTAAEELRKQPNDAGLDQAIEKYQQLLDLNAHFALGYARIALAYVRKYQLAHNPAALTIAEKNAKLALEYNSESPSADLSAALVYLYSGRTAQSLDSLASALRLDPGNPELLFYQAVAYRQLNRPNDEENTYRLIVKERPNYFRAYNELGLALYRQGRYAESAVIFQEAAQVAPRQALPLTNLGVAYLLLGQKKDAAAAFRASIARAPTGLAYLNLGNMAFEEGNYPKALEFYLQARDLKPSDDLTLRNIADCYFVLGDQRKAQENYEKAAAVLSGNLKTNPKNGPGWMTLAFYEAKLGHRARAEGNLNLAESSGAADVQSQFFKAQTLAVLGSKREAVDVLVACVRRGLSPVEVQLALDLKEILNDRRYLQQVSALQQSKNNPK